ncbi:hypothetical protein F5148DRAFT_3576 [Russula earlei]|uniref:Uncharacterized protein n=1 Tax=Russula earlei TaxID=71964 RepID=A0ACC0UQN0_9AGAM|nr:hypothetical protein F5148DRAFT_3576 [Russula earlei]
MPRRSPLLSPMSSHSYSNSPYKSLSSSVHTGAVSQFPNTSTRITGMVGISDIPTIQHIFTPSPYELYGQTSRGNNFQHRAIDVLPEDTLLEIFDFYRLDAIDNSRGRPWKWHRLAHVCRKWRHVVSVSPLRLGLKIYCKSRVPIKPILDLWPTLPLVVRFKGPESKALHKNFLVALRRPDRVREIDLILSSSIVPSTEIQESFLALERIKLKSCYNFGTPVLTKFLGGSAPRLTSIEVDGVAIPFPALRKVLLSTNNLVRLQLDNITSAGYFSPEAIVTVLSHPALVRLSMLHFHFHSFALPKISSRASHPFLERATLPSLTDLRFRGTHDYLEEFVSRIDTPALVNAAISFDNQLIFETQQLCNFIYRMGKLNSLRDVVVALFSYGVTIDLFQPADRERQRWECMFGMRCKGLDWQLSFATQILGRLSPHFSGVSRLKVITGEYSGELAGEEDLDLTQWLEIFQAVPRIVSLDVAERFVPGVVHALVTEGPATATGTFPRVLTLRLRGYKSSSVRKEVEDFVAARKLSGHGISLYG